MGPAGSPPSIASIRGWYAFAQREVKAAFGAIERTHDGLEQASFIGELRPSGGRQREARRQIA
jgi:hypothetical protein